VRRLTSGSRRTDGSRVGPSRAQTTTPTARSRTPTSPAKIAQHQPRGPLSRLPHHLRRHHADRTQHHLRRLHHDRERRPPGRRECREAILAYAAASAALGTKQPRRFRCASLARLQPSHGRPSCSPPGGTPPRQNRCASGVHGLTSQEHSRETLVHPTPQPERKLTKG
jgi:hypothetical protein